MFIQGNMNRAQRIRTDGCCVLDRGDPTKGPVDTAGVSRIRPGETYSVPPPWMPCTTAPTVLTRSAGRPRVI